MKESADENVDLEHHLIGIQIKMTITGKSGTVAALFTSAAAFCAAMGRRIAVCLLSATRAVALHSQRFRIWSARFSTFIAASFTASLNVGCE